MSEENRKAVEALVSQLETILKMAQTEARIDGYHDDFHEGYRLAKKELAEEVK